MQHSIREELVFVICCTCCIRFFTHR